MRLAGPHLLPGIPGITALVTTVAAPVSGPYAARGDFLGPVVTTTLRTWTSPGAMHVLLAVIGLDSVPLVGLREARTAP